MKNVSFEEHKPSKKLTNFIHSYWLGNFNLLKQPTFNQSVLPNGCIEIIIHLSDRHCFLIDSSSQFKHTADYIVLGLFDTPYNVSFDNNVNVFGIRLYPDGFINIFGHRPKELNASYENGIDFFGIQFSDFCNRLKELVLVKDRIDLTNTFFEGHLARNYKSHDYTHLTMSMIRNYGGILNYNQIVSNIPISQRQLQREFKNVYGISVRDYLRIMRFNAIHNYMLSGQALNLTELSYELSFADQSHFVKEYKRFSGVSPKVVMREMGSFIVNPS